MNFIFSKIGVTVTMVGGDFNSNGVSMKDKSKVGTLKFTNKGF